VADEQRQWHRLFGLSWMDFFRGQPVQVDMERDLSLKKQLLDVLLIRKEAGVLTCQMPDGFDNLARFNLVTFKSHQEKLSVWALLELVGHYVNVRKQESPSMDEDDLLAEDQFRLFAVSVRFPQQMAERVQLREVQQGVYDVDVLGRSIRIVVVNQLPEQQQNALLQLFSSRVELFQYAITHYPRRSTETSSLFQLLFLRAPEVMPIMPDQLEKLRRETIDQILKDIPPEELLKRFSPEELLKRFSPEERLKGLTTAEIVKGLPPETLQEIKQSKGEADAKSE
jgi:hypothetical protein